jgi:hypothetical protein
MIAAATQIDDGFDAQLREALQAFLGRLRPAVDMFIHLVKVRYSRSARLCRDKYGGREQNQLQESSTKYH